MPRKVRVEYRAAIYHVMSRGDRREDIFYDDLDRQDFLRTLAEACLKADFRVHAYCLISNHFHLVLKTPDGNLSAGMRSLLSSYSLRLNHRRKVKGHVFCVRYKSILVDGSADGYLKTFGEDHSGELRRESAEAKAERILSEELRRLGWSRRELLLRRKSDPAKLALADRLRRETIQSVKAIAESLHLGSPKTARARLRKFKRRKAPRAIRKHRS